MKKHHPCFHKEDHKTHARVHIPVAPKCNVQCNFCNRKYDCVNESRPGVTSAVLTPMQARDYFVEVKSRVPNLAVVGIAGPGDPLANPWETLESLNEIREEDPDVSFCISTNGLALAEHAGALKKAGVSHVTLTLNSLDEKTLSKIYSWVRPSKRVYRGEEAGVILKKKQMDGLDAAIEAGFMVKVNTILLPGVNDKEIPQLARFLQEKGVDVHNILPLKPVAGTPFATLEEPSKQMLADIRETAGKFLPQMTHCQRCRADAVGLLGDKNPEELTASLQRISRGEPSKKRPYVAVCSREGFLVNEHLGEARDFRIYGWDNGKASLVERRMSPPRGSGDERWDKVAELLKDCAALLVSGVGPNPQKTLIRSGLAVHTVEGLIGDGVERIFTGENLESMKPRNSFSCGAGCQGNAQGCG